MEAVAMYSPDGTALRWITVWFVAALRIDGSYRVEHGGADSYHPCVEGNLLNRSRTH